MLAIRPGPDEVAIVTRPPNESLVVRERGLRVPWVQRVDMLDVSPKFFDIRRRGREGLVSADYSRLDVSLSVEVRLRDDDESLIRAAEALGCERASDPRALEELLVPKMVDLLADVVASLDSSVFLQATSGDDSAGLLDRLVASFEADIPLFFVEEIQHFSALPTPGDRLDTEHILDVQGLRRSATRRLENLRHTLERERVAREEIEEQDDRTDTAVAGLEAADRSQGEW